MGNDNTNTICINKVTYRFEGDMGIGYTAKNEKFLFDREDFDKIKGCRWCFDRQGYVVAFMDEDGRRKIVRLHCLIMGEPPSGKQIDHIRNTEGLCSRKADNRKSNLRFATPAQNSWNKGLRSNNTSGHTGVYRKEPGNRILVKVTKGGKAKSKVFPQDRYHEACLWQEKMAVQMYGEFAYKYDTAAPQGAEPGC